MVLQKGRPEDNQRQARELRCYDLLDELNIPYERVDHDAAYDMGACGVISQVLGVRICKNLLLTPRNRSAFYLLAMPDDLPFRTADFSKIIGSSRLSFATEEDLRDLLGVQIGSASVLGLMNDTEHRVTLAMERRVADAEWFGCHPCRNTCTLRMKMHDLLYNLLPAWGVRPDFVELPEESE